MRAMTRKQAACTHESIRRFKYKRGSAVICEVCYLHFAPAPARTELVLQLASATLSRRYEADQHCAEMKRQIAIYEGAAERVDELTRTIVARDRDVTDLKRMLENSEQQLVRSRRAAAITHSALEHVLGLVTN